MNGCAAYMKSLETALFRVSWDASLASSEISDRSLGIYCSPFLVADKSFRSITEDIAMANKEPFESLTGIEQYVQVTERTKHAMENYLSWVQNAMSGSPWVNNDLNKKLLSYTTENVTAAVEHVQKLSQAKRLEDVVKIQTEFISKQLGTFNEQTKTIVEI